MRDFRIIFSGEFSIEAEDEEEAKEKFYSLFESRKFFNILIDVDDVEEE